MKTNRTTPEAGRRKGAKVSSQSKSSKKLKPSPCAENSSLPKAKPRTSRSKTQKASPVAEALSLETAAPQDDATQSVPHQADAVRARAYLNYQKRGPENGDHMGDWLRAEAELAAERQLPKRLTSS